MEISKATGVHTIPPKVIRIAAPYISNVVAKLFNTSFTCGRFLSTCKTARVTALFKGGPQTEYNNYRTIFIPPCISKVHESFANTDLQGSAADTGLISDHQFAYAYLSHCLYFLGPRTLLM